MSEMYESIIAERDRKISALATRLAAADNALAEMDAAAIRQGAELAKVQAEATRLREAIESEPEFPGPMEPEMYDTIKGLDKAGLEEWCRIIVRETKKGIMERLAQPKETPHVE